MITADISISKLWGEKSLNLSIELLISQLDLEQESLTLLPRVAWGTQRHTPELLLLPRAFRHHLKQGVCCRREGGARGSMAREKEHRVPAGGRA